MITGDLKNKIDKIWETFWTGGITNPLDVIEQFTYLLFIKQLDDVETTKENEANFLGEFLMSRCFRETVRSLDGASSKILVPQMRCMSLL